MNAGNKRKDNQQDDSEPKRIKKECDYGKKCYRRNPAHFREFSHPHLEAILNKYQGTGPYPIPDEFSMDRITIEEQLEVLTEKKIYTPWVTSETAAGEAGTSSATKTESTLKGILKKPPTPKTVKFNLSDISDQDNSKQGSKKAENPQCSKKLFPQSEQNSQTNIVSPGSNAQSSKDVPPGGSKQDSTKEVSNTQSSSKNEKDKNSVGNSSSAGQNLQRQTSSDYRPIVAPVRRAEDMLSVVATRGRMLAKLAARAPYHLFYTTIAAARDTHAQPYSITFLELLDHSLGELKCSLQINFMVELGWLLAQYYFAGYSAKKLTILYGEDSEDLQTISQKKPHIDAHKVKMGSPFGTHHTKMMILCYEDGSLRVVVSTANLYLDDWENRVQGLWFSPKCPELPPEAMPHDGDSPTLFKKSLLQYLNKYHLPALTPYVERVKRCDFSHINVFFVASVPGGHFDADWGLKRTAALLRQHCCIPPAETSKWPLLAQASSLGSYGDKPSLWLTGDFLHSFTKIKEQPQTLCQPPPFRLIYPALENVQNSHDRLLGGGCLPYAASVHTRQLWLNEFLYQWRAKSTKRDRAMPHIKCYTRVSPGHSHAAYFLLTSANCSKAAWGSINKGNAALRIMSYEAGVLFLPQFVIKEDLFPLAENSKNRLVLPYDLPLTKYESDMSPWVSDYLRQ